MFFWYKTREKSLIFFTVLWTLTFYMLLSRENEVQYYAQYTTLNRCSALVVQLLGSCPLEGNCTRARGQNN